MDKKTLLRIRMRKKRKKPEFIRQEYYTHPQRLGRKWRQPMGRTSKLRYKEKPRGSQPSMGYGSPAEVRGLSRFGHALVRVHNASELSGITDTKAMAAVIAAGVGAKKKLEIIGAAKQKGILVFNRPKKNLEKPKKDVSEKKGGQTGAEKKDERAEPKKEERKKEENKPK